MNLALPAAREEVGADPYPSSQSSNRHCGNPSWPIRRCGWIPLWPAWAPPLRDRSGRDKGNEKTHSKKMRGAFFSISQTCEWLLSLDGWRDMERKIEAREERLKSNSQMHSGNRDMQNRWTRGAVKGPSFTAPLVHRQAKSKSWVQEKNKNEVKQKLWLEKKRWNICGKNRQVNLWVHVKKNEKPS